MPGSTLILRYAARRNKVPAIRPIDEGEAGRSGRAFSGGHKETRRRRRAFVMTDTELKLMVALAIMGLSNQPRIG